MPRLAWGISTEGVADRAGELQGLDLHEHGGPAYPDLYNVGIGTEGLTNDEKP